ncbi:MFS transporter [Pokkaliibacter sp. CJK22405]|uniref:MFS transporter n=1 Tax=Pokkaliibacter sp. CJK22405 TaxID=3384615 RepID=UPI003984D2DE
MSDTSLLNNQDRERTGSPRLESTCWSAVFALALSVATVLITELLPVSLLTPMAHDLDISEGLAGQSLTATALVAIFSSLLTARVTQGIDRRKVVMGFSALLMLSNVIVALSSDFLWLCVGRLILGLALGGFWAMAPALTMRLSQQQDIPRAMSIVFGGVSVALVLAAPLGSFLEVIVGWRGVFAITGVLGVVCLLWQALSFPKLPSTHPHSFASLWRTACRPGMAAALLAMFLVFGGQFTFFSYMRPFYESFAGFKNNELSAIFLAFGIANVIGTSLSSYFIQRGLKKTLQFAPLVIGISALLLAMLGENKGLTIVMTLVWGFVFGAVPVGWSTWITRNFSEEAENAGGLQVAVIQIANTLGAAVGGYLLIVAGAVSPVFCAGILMILTSVVIAGWVTSQ